MKFCRYILLILLTVAVPTSGYASVTMQHCRDAAQPSSGHEHQHHVGMSMEGMSVSEHQQHMHHAAPKNADSPVKVSSACKCGCPCSGHCPPGSCMGSVGLLSAALFPSNLPGSKQVTHAIQPHALTAHHLDHLRPPISAAT